MSQLQGKVALITGASRGIGRATAVELARRGARVALTARNRAELESLAGELESLGTQAIALPADLDDPQVPDALIRETEQRLDPVQILVNNAAIVGPFGNTWAVDPEAWERALRLNLHVPFRLARLVIPGMIERGWGRIINVSSGAARNPMERAGPYSVSKAGLDMLTRQLGIELEGTGVAVVSLYPGVVDTDMQTEVREQPAEVVGRAMSERFRGYYESGRLQPPERPARLIAALAGDAGARYSGQIVDSYTDEAQRLINEQ